jgi:uncharacterized protein YukE
MAITEFQRTVCRLIARQRVESGVSYVAGAVALNTLTDSPRQSHDVDIFHDAREAVAISWAADRKTLEGAGYGIQLVRERDTFVEALVSKGSDRVVLEWALDSAFRFFPLMSSDDFGLTLHPFDLATNKVLALVGRLEVRDWLDVIQCHHKIQRLGYLAWAACGKDPGFSPATILDQAGRTARYSNTEVAALSFSGAAPDAAALSRTWHDMLDEGRSLIAALPPAWTGTCVLDSSGSLFTGGLAQLQEALQSSSLRFHQGSLHGAWPLVR